MVERVNELNASVRWVLETHVHADHLSAAAYLKEKLGGHTAIGAHITQVQKVFGALFNAEPGFARDGSQFDVLLEDEEGFRIGNLQARALHTPGHTPACMSFMIEDAGEIAVFVGDTLFMPDYGTARCDFPGGDARQLYASIQRLLAYPPATRLYVCHDYPPPGRELQCQSSVAEQRAHNIHVHDGIDEATFVEMRTRRDAGLGMPTLLLPAIQVNVRAGNLPAAEDNGVVYLKIPINKL